MAKTRIYVILLLSIATLTLIFLVLSCESQVDVEKEVQDAPIDFGVYATTICRDYEANEVAADEKYKDRVGEVRGIVGRTSKYI